ncbi:MAG TPA: aspartate aminotransferase family protein [Bacteroidales bacterium]|nr:aspartate aminotransferase family protein [Bacteroidales bacterium]
MPTQRDLFFRYLGLPSLNAPALEISRAAGVFLYGPDGKDYVDLVSGVAVSNLGHQHPDIVNAVREQAGKHLHLMVYGDLVQSPQVLLAEKLASCLPSALRSVYFVTSGSEAIEGALKLAKRYTGRTGVVAFHKAYHGGTHGALSICGDERLKTAFRPLLPDITHIKFNRFEDLDQITDKTACVVVETIQAEAGIVLPAAGFLEALRAKCTETGALLVIDDIQMGMGRTGKLFSFEHCGIVPDILCLAKAFGGGMPLGAFISSKYIMQSLAHDPELGHITTFGGHPVSCTAALASLNYLVNTGIFEAAEQKAQMFIESLAGHPAIKTIRHKGLMIGIDLESIEMNQKLMKAFHENGLIADSFLFRPQAFRIAPPLIITEEEIEMTCERIIASLNRL